VVADSPFYKLLIGRMLGYKEDNIVHHIKASSFSLVLHLVLKAAVMIYRCKEDHIAHHIKEALFW